ncbi:MAG: hypothetical protein RLZZ28_389 [Bacteroidota bacterium]
MKQSLWVVGISVFLIAYKPIRVFSQDSDSVLAKQFDLADLSKKLFAKPQKKQEKKASTVAMLPSIGYNPSIGFQLGLNVSGGFYLGKPKTTTMSVFSIVGFGTTKGIITGQLRHNVFTKDNRWNLQGNMQLSRMVSFDYGVGTGITIGSNGYFEIDGIPLDNDSALFPIKLQYTRFTERAYRKIGQHLYAAIGLSFDIRSKINDTKLDSTGNTPHYKYSAANGYNPGQYNANGLLFNLLYYAKEHPNRSYRGIYTDIGIRVNQTWLGSSYNSIQLLTELRKYWSLSATNPEHVLAIWHMGNYLLQGKLPYLELPGTGLDTWGRGGRGYTIGRFKGLSFFTLETEYRFPITRNKFLGGVVFANIQSASNQTGIHLFDYWEPAMGSGLRFLFKKNTRTSLCIDYAVGRYGSKGLFFGLNEVF